MQYYVSIVVLANCMVSCHLYEANAKNENEDDDDGNNNDNVAEDETKLSRCHSWQFRLQIFTISPELFT